MEGLLERNQSEQNAALLWVANDTDQLKRVANRSATLSTGGQLSWN
jgi:ABC-type iron transport system FetAB ATPase subunit